MNSLAPPVASLPTCVSTQFLFFNTSENNNIHLPSFFIWLNFLYLRLDQNYQITEKHQVIIIVLSVITGSIKDQQHKHRHSVTFISTAWPNLQCQCYDRDSQSHRLQLIKVPSSPFTPACTLLSISTDTAPTQSTPPGLNSYCLSSCFTAERVSVIVFVSNASSEYQLVLSEVLPSVIVSTWSVITLNHCGLH